jgi:hypothetical protein
MQKQLRAASGANIDDEIVGPVAEFGDVKIVRQVFGLRERLTYDLLHAGLIRSAMIGVGGSARGKRLFDLNSIRDFIRSREAAGPDFSPSPADYKKLKLSACRQ